MRATLPRRRYSRPRRYRPRVPVRRTLRRRYRPRVLRGRRARPRPIRRPHHRRRRPPFIVRRRPRYYWWRRRPRRTVVVLPSPPYGYGGGVLLTSRLSTAARRALRAAGLASGRWRARLAAADPALLRFINRFHRAAGFALVVRDAFAGPRRAATARLARRLARRLADSDSSPGGISFRRVHGLTAGGEARASLVVVDRDAGVRYVLLPWRVFRPWVLARQLARDVALFRNPTLVRYVLDDARAPPRREVIRAFRQAAWQGGGRLQRWLRGIENRLRRV